MKLNPLAQQFANDLNTHISQWLQFHPTQLTNISIGPVSISLQAEPWAIELITQAFLCINQPSANNSHQKHHIIIWDGTLPNQKPPPKPWGPIDHEPLGIVKSYSDDQIRCAVDFETNALIVFEKTATGSRTLIWFPDITKLPQWYLASPFRIPLSWILSTENIQMVHGAALASPLGAILLAGKSGSGKSTTALACAFERKGYVGDDYCAYDVNTKELLMVYRTGKMTAKTLALFLNQSYPIKNQSLADGEKAIVYFSDPPASLVSRSPLKKILLPKITSELESQIRPATSQDALQAILPTTMSELMGGSRSTPKRLLMLSHAAPAFHLNLGENIGQLVKLISSCLDSI